jgi:chemotaxis protein MotA
MFTAIGIGIVLVATLVGYLMHGGNFVVLLQINEFVILGGAAIGSIIAAQGIQLDRSAQTRPLHQGRLP